MPEGMLLRSPRQASTISDPASLLTLEHYEAEAGLKPMAPVPLKTFVDYGCWFQSKLGPCHTPTNVLEVSRQGSRFRLTLANGEVVTSQRLVVAAGVGAFRNKPAPFSDLPAESMSHCYEGRQVREFAGKRVAVIGAGQSALESAALWHEGGAEVEIIARIGQLRWIGMHTWLHKLGPISSMLYAWPDVGPAGINRLVAAPKVVYLLPLSFKDKIRTRAVRPAGSRWLPARLAQVKVTTGCGVKQARSTREGVLLDLEDGTQRQVDHVLLGTGYRVKVADYKFLADDLRAQIRQQDGYPVIGPGLCASVPNLHFVGAPAARNFGPLLYFVAGTGFASKELASKIGRRGI